MPYKGKGLLVSVPTKAFLPRTLLEVTTQTEHLMVVLKTFKCGMYWYALPPLHLGTGYRGMWHDPDHLAERSHCLNHLARIYNGSLPLWYSDIVTIPLRRT